MEDWYVFGCSILSFQDRANECAESSPEWDMQELLQNGVFPNPVTNRNRKSILDVSDLGGGVTTWLTTFFKTDPGQCN
jgi:hypothetical protein